MKKHWYRLSPGMIINIQTAKPNSTNGIIGIEYVIKKAKIININRAQINC